MILFSVTTLMAETIWRTYHDENGGGFRDVARSWQGEGWTVDEQLAGGGRAQCRRTSRADPSQMAASGCSLEDTCTWCRWSPFFSGAGTRTNTWVTLRTAAPYFNTGFTCKTCTQILIFMWYILPHRCCFETSPAYRKMTRRIQWTFGYPSPQFTNF